MMDKEQIKRLATILLPLGEAYFKAWSDAIEAGEEDIESLNDEHEGIMQSAVHDFCDNNGIALPKDWQDEIGTAVYAATEGYDAPGRGWDIGIVESEINDVLKRANRARLDN